MAGFSVLWIGRPSADLPADVDYWLAGAATVYHLANADEAVELLRSLDAPVDLIVACQSRTGELDAATFDRLRRAAPLTPVWRLMGSWCEGESRSGRPTPATPGQYWHQWRPRLARERASAAAGRCPTWGLPPTATAEERMRALSAPRWPRGHGRIAICAPTRATAAALADVCQAAGHETHVLRQSDDWPPSQALAALWDTTPDALDDRAMLAKFRACLAGAPVFALVGFPRAADCQRAATAGVAGVISKPFVISDLLWHLRRIPGTKLV